MSNKQKLHHSQLVNHQHPNLSQQQEILNEINKQSCDESDLFDNLDQSQQLHTRMVYSSSENPSSFLTQQQQEELNQQYLNHQTILNPHDLNNNFDNLFSQESDHHSISNHHNPSPHILLPSTSSIQPSHANHGLNQHTFSNGINAPLDSFMSNDMLTTSTFIHTSYIPNSTTQAYPSLNVQKPESNADFSFRQMQFNSNPQGLLVGSSDVYNDTSSFEKREFGPSPLTFKENSHLSKTEMMTNDLVYNEQQKDYSFISDGERESNNVSSKQKHHQHTSDTSNLDAISFSIEDDSATACSFSTLPTTSLNNNNNNLFNNIQHRSTPNIIQRSRSHSLHNPLRRDANQTFNIDGMVNTYMNNNNTNLQQQQHLYSPSSSNSSFASSPNNCSSMQHQLPSSTDVLTNAPIMDNSYQHTSSLHPMNGSPTIAMDKIIQNKAKRTIRSRSFHSKDKMEISDAMMMDNNHSYQYFGFNANNNNSVTYSPTSSAGCSSMEQSPPPSPLATFLSQIDISKLNQEQLAALQVLCMSNQNNLTSPVSNTYTSSNEVVVSNSQQQRRSSVASYMSEDSSTTLPRDSLLKTVLQKQLHTNNEVVDENQALYSMIDNALSGCKSSLGLKLVTNETPVNNFPTRSRTFSSPPQFQITHSTNVPQEIVSPMSRSSEETVPTIEISNNNTFNFGSFGTDYEQSFENNQTSVHPRHHSSPAINTFVNRVEKPTKTKRKSSSVRGSINNASSSTGQLEQNMVASAVSAVASNSSNNSKKGSRRNSISSVEQQPIVATKQNKSQNKNKTIVFNNYYDEIQFKKKYGPNSTFYKFK